MQELMGELKMLKENKKKLSEWLSCAIEAGPESFDVLEAGAVTDMIKDLAEAEEKCMKAKYYEMLIGEMMSQDEDMCELGRMGYDNWRYSSGKFAPKGRGTYVGHGSNLKMGYRPYPPNFADLRRPQEPWNPIYPTEMMGYDNPEEIVRRGGTRWDSDNRMSYPNEDWEDDRIGRSYNEYLNARKHYTETRDPEESHKMNNKILEATMETSETMGEMWRDANPETRKQMEANLTKLMDEWKRSK